MLPGELWLPKRFEIIRGGRTPTVELLMPAIGIKGFITVDLIDAKTQKIKRHLEFDNLITDAGLDVWMVSNNLGAMTNHLAVGTGNTTPAVGQTALVAEIQRTSTSDTADVYTANNGAGFAKRTRSRLFVEAEANGNLAELGFFSAGAGGTMWARQLFKDGTGTPIVLTKTASEQLRVNYELRIYSPADLNGTVTISGTVYNFTTRAVGTGTIDANSWGGSDTFSLWNGEASIGNYDQRADETNTLIAGTAYNNGGTTNSSKSLAAYVPGTFYRDQTSIWEPGVANFATGVGTIFSKRSTISNAGAMFQTVFTPIKVPKTNVQRLTLVSRWSWGRYP